MKNKMTDLNNHLFLQLEKLLDPDLSDDELKKEIARAGAVSSIAANIIQNANTAIKAMSMFENRQIESDSPALLRISKGQQNG